MSCNLPNFEAFFSSNFVKNLNNEFFHVYKLLLKLATVFLA